MKKIEIKKIVKDYDVFPEDLDNFLGFGKSDGYGEELIILEGDDGNAYGIPLTYHQEYGYMYGRQEFKELPMDTLIDVKEMKKVKVTKYEWVEK